MGDDMLSYSLRWTECDESRLLVWCYSQYTHIMHQQDIYIFATKKLPNIAWKGFDLKLRAIWDGLWHNGDIFSLRTIRICTAILKRTISEEKNSSSNVMSPLLFGYMQIIVWKFNFALCQMISLYFPRCQRTKYISKCISLQNIIFGKEIFFNRVFPA